MIAKGGTLTFCFSEPTTRVAFCSQTKINIQARMIELNATKTQSTLPFTKHSRGSNTEIFTADRSRSKKKRSAFQRTYTTPWWRPKGGLRKRRGAADRLKQQHERRQHCESRSRLRFPPSVHLLSVNRRTMRVERKYLAPLLFHGPVLKYKYMLGPSFLLEQTCPINPSRRSRRISGFFYSVFVDWFHCDRVTIVGGRVHHCPCCFLTNV